MDEIFERINICDGDRRLGYASVRYPVIGNKYIDKYYKRLATVFFESANAKKLCGALNCKITYEDEENLSVITELRLYKERECVYRYSNSFVWNKKRGTLCYLRKRGIRRCNLTYNGTELSIFN